jgi:hypothetical protein
MSFFRKLIIPFSLLFLLALSFSGCGVARQAQQASNLASCDFRIASVEHVNLAGVELQRIRSVSDLGIGDVARILAGFASPVFPLSLQLNLEGRNPNLKEAGLNRLEWILFIDDIQMTSGLLDQPFMIPPMSSLMIPVEVGLDLKQALSGNSANAMLNFCMNLAGTGNTPTRFKIKLKPTVIIAGAAVTYPGYITVNTTYGAK